MYESKHQELLPRHKFIWRILVHFFYAILVIASILMLGVLGNVLFEDISLHDAIFNVALIIAGIGSTALP